MLLLPCVPDTIYCFWNLVLLICFACFWCFILLLMFVPLCCFVSLVFFAPGCFWFLVPPLFFAPGSSCPLLFVPTGSYASIVMLLDFVLCLVCSLLLVHLALSFSVSDFSVPSFRALLLFVLLVFKAPYALHFLPLECHPKFSYSS